MPDSLYPFLATVAYALLLTGFLLRARGSLRHAWLMSAGMAIDVSLVLVLEVTRNAIAIVLREPLSTSQTVHVAASTLAVLFYLPVFILGLQRLRNPSPANLRLRGWHRKLGYAALGFRTVGFAFMFSIVGRAHG